jgi:hypothetical protein
MARVSCSDWRLWECFKVRVGNTASRAALIRKVAIVCVQADSIPASAPESWGTTVNSRGLIWRDRIHGVRKNAVTAPVALLLFALPVAAITLLSATAAEWTARETTEVARIASGSRYAIWVKAVLIAKTLHKYFWVRAILALLVRRTLAARLILTHTVTAVLAFVATDLGLPFPAALLGRWATFLPAAEVTFWAALLSRAHAAADAGILATGLGTGGPAADIGLLATGGRGTAAFARRGAILTATLAAGH